MKPDLISSRWPEGSNARVVHALLLWVAFVALVHVTRLVLVPNLLPTGVPGLYPAGSMFCTIEFTGLGPPCGYIAVGVATRGTGWL